MFGSKHFLFLLVLSVQCLVGAGKTNKHASFHKKATARNFIQAKNARRNPFHSTQDINDLVKNPTALNSDEASEINKLDSFSDVYMNPEVTSESQDLSQQGLDPSVAMQISKMDHNFQDILGSRRPGMHLHRSTAKQKGEILSGYGEEYNADGSVNLSNNQWPEYQMKDTPPMMNMNKQTPDNMFLGNDDTRPQVSPQAALNPNLLPGQKSDLGMGMGVGMPGMGMGKGPGAPMMSRFVANGKSSDKSLTNAPFAQPKIKNAGFRIPGEFSYKGERKSAQSQEDANFVKNFMSSKKSRTERRKTTKKMNH